MNTSLKYMHIKCMILIKDLWLNLDHESYPLSLKQTDIQIFQKSLGCVSSIRKIVWKMKKTFYFTVRFILIQERN